MKINKILLMVAIFVLPVMGHSATPTPTFTPTPACVPGVASAQLQSQQLVIQTLQSLGMSANNLSSISPSIPFNAASSSTTPVVAIAAGGSGVYTTIVPGGSIVNTGSNAVSAYISSGSTTIWGPQQILANGDQLILRPLPQLTPNASISLNLLAVPTVGVVSLEGGYVTHK